MIQKNNIIYVDALSVRGGEEKEDTNDKANGKILITSKSG
jgi:hypothetical protein